MMKNFKGSILFVLILGPMLLCADSYGQRTRRFSRDAKSNSVSKKQDRPIVYKRKTVLRFDDSLIMGDVKNPREFYFVHRPEKNFKSLLKRRKNFHKEMLRDAVLIR